MLIIIYIEILFYAKNYKLLLQGLLFSTIYFSVIYGQSVPPDFSTIARSLLVEQNKYQSLKMTK